MPYLVLGVALLLGLLLLARLFVNADPGRLGRFMGWFVVGLGVAGAGTGLVLLVMTDRFALVILLVGGLVALVRSREWRRRWQAATAPTGKTSEVETEFLRMRLDHVTGSMSGAVRRGAFVGRRIEDLSQDELFALWRECGAADEPSARLLESYLDRLMPDWRAQAGRAAPAGDVMTREEAYAVLGLAPGADAGQIREAHRRLMMKLHPDLGGSTYLAIKINRAKEILLSG